MYELIATAAAGLQAGVGLHAAIAGAPSTGLAATSYHTRTRFLSLILSATSCGCAVTAYKAEGHGELWLVAAAGAALSIPYQLLLMTPPSPMISNNNSALGTPAPDPALTMLDSHKTANEEALFHPNAASPIPGTPPGPMEAQSRLLYTRSGVLMTPEAAASAASRRYWFGAALSCASFAAMMAIIATRKEVTSYNPPY